MNDNEFQEKMAKALVLTQQLELKLAHPQARAMAMELELELKRAMELGQALEQALERAMELEQARAHPLHHQQMREIINILKELQQELQKPNEPQIADSLELSIEVPENVSEEELRDIIRQAALHADSVHRANGGKGLKLDGVEVFEESRVPGGVK